MMIFCSRRDPKLTQLQGPGLCWKLHPLHKLIQGNKGMKRGRKVKPQEERPEDLYLLMDREKKQIAFRSALGIDFVMELTICCNSDLSYEYLRLLVCMLVKSMTKLKYCGPELAKVNLKLSLNLYLLHESHQFQKMECSMLEHQRAECYQNVGLSEK